MVSMLNVTSGLTKLSFCNVGADLSVTRQGIPLFVHKSGGTTFRKDDQVQFFFWPIKRDAVVTVAKK